MVFVFSILKENFITEDIFIKHMENECTMDEITIDVFKLEMKYFSISGKFDKQTEIIYGNSFYEVVVYFNKTPHNCQPALYFIRICCLKHMTETNRKIIIDNKQDNMKYYISL